jgi:hypothetical protein
LDELTPIDEFIEQELLGLPPDWREILQEQDAAGDDEPDWTEHEIGRCDAALIGVPCSGACGYPF